MTKESNGHILHVNPDELHKNPAFTQAITVTGNVRTIYVGGQDALDRDGVVVGKGDIQLQTEQVFRNLQTALAACGASLENIVKWNIYIVQGQPLPPAFGVFQTVWGRRPNPPVITVMYVAGLANPDFLVEMDAVAVIPA